MKNHDEEILVHNRRLYMNKTTFEQYLSRIRSNDTTLTTFNLKNYMISDEEIKALAAALKVNTSLQVLNLSLCGIDDQKAIELSEGLRSNNSLTALYLGSNNIRSKGVAEIAKALESKKSLETLDLGGNKIGPEGAKAVVDILNSNTPLRMLDLCGCRIENEGIAAIMSVLISNRTIESLNLSSNSITNEGLREIARMLESNESLSELYLYNNEFGTEITVLADALKKNHTLTLLDIKFNLIPAGAARSFRKAIELNHNLLSLNVRFNQADAFEEKEIKKLLNRNHDDYYHKVQSLLNDLNQNIENLSEDSLPIINDLLNQVYIISQILQKNGYAEAAELLDAFYIKMVLDSIKDHNFEAAVEWILKIQEVISPFINMEFAEAILAHDFTGSFHANPDNYRLLVFALLRDNNTSSSERLKLNMFHLLRGGSGLLSDFDSTLPLYIGVDDVLTIEQINNLKLSNNLKSLEGRKIVLYEHLALSPKYTDIFFVKANRLVDEKNKEIDIDEIQANFEALKTELLSDIQNHFDSVFEEGILQSFTEYKEKDDKKVSTQTDEEKSHSNLEINPAADLLYRLNLDNSFLNDLQDHWTAFGKAPSDNHLIDNIGKFINTLNVKDNSRIFLENSDLDKNTEAYHALRNLIAYAGKLQGDLNNHPDDLLLNDKLKNIKKFIRTVLNQDNLSSKSISKAYDKFEQQDQSRSIFGLYRLRTRALHKNYYNDKGKLKPVKSKAGELVFDFMQAIKNIDNTVHSEEEKVTRSSLE